jgi:hypothetical protein
VSPVLPSFSQSRDHSYSKSLSQTTTAFFWGPGCFSSFLGILCAEVDDAQDSSWRHCFTAWLYLAAKPVHMGVDVDELACPCNVLRNATNRRGDRASCQAMSCPVAAVGGGTSPGDVKPPGLDILWSLDRMGTCTTKSYME